MSEFNGKCYTTHTRKLENITVTAGDILVVAQENFAGMLKELILVIDGSDNLFDLQITADGREIIEESFDDLEAYYDAYCEDVEADSGGVKGDIYVNIRDIYFERELKITIRNVTETGGIAIYRSYVKLYEWVDKK